MTEPLSDPLSLLAIEVLFSGEVGLGTMDLETMERSPSSLEQLLITYRGKTLGERK